MRRPRLWLPLSASITTALACGGAPTGPDVGLRVGAEVVARAPAAAPDQPSRGPLAFRTLAPGDVVAVAIEASGCFHRDTYDLRIAVEPDGSLVLSGSRTSHAALPGEAPEPEGFEPRLLTAAEVVGLDRLLAYYRAGPGDGCTSTHTTRLRQLRGGVPYREESYRDGSCGVSDADGVVSFFALVQDRVLKSR